MPRFYVVARDPGADIDLTALQSMYDQHPDIVATEIVMQRPDTYVELSVAGDTVIASPTDILTAIQAALEEHNPDVLVCSTSEIISTLYEMAATAGVNGFTLDRVPDIDYQQFASWSTYSKLRPRRPLAGAVQCPWVGNHQRE